MANVKVKLVYDPTGRDTNNLISSEPHTLTAVNGFPYKIITLEHGGFYTKSLRVYDADYNKLVPGTDYIFTYHHPILSARLGLDICSAIVFLNKTRTGTVYTSAQMVGGDEAFSLTVIDDYVNWYKQQVANYVPRENDYNGDEPQWSPGELEKERWKLDTFEPFNNEIYQLSRATTGAVGTFEQDYRDQVTADYDAFLDTFTTRLDDHINNKLNPHQDTKADVGLDLVQNYAVATDAQARQGTLNTLYLTPLLSWSVVDQFALQPLNSHIGNTSNPHRTTPATINAPTKAVVDAAAAKKYLRNATVVNANYFSNGTLKYTYSEYYNLARTKIPAGNFVAGGANGYIAPQRLGRGTANVNTVLRGDGQWVTWDAIIVERGAPASPQIHLISGNFASAAAGHQAAMADPWTWTAGVGSMVFYTATYQLRWGAGNGGYTNTVNTLYGSFRTATGWVQI